MDLVVFPELYPAALRPCLDGGTYLGADAAGGEHWILPALPRSITDHAVQVGQTGLTGIDHRPDLQCLFIPTEPPFGRAVHLVVYPARHRESLDLYMDAVSHARFGQFPAAPSRGGLWATLRALLCGV